MFKWNKNISSNFFVNVFLFNISSWNCYHKHDVYNLIYMIFFVGVKNIANISRKTKNHKCTCKTSTWFSSIYYVCGNSFKMKWYIRKHLQKKDLIFFRSKFKISANFTKFKISTNEKLKQLSHSSQEALVLL